MPAKLMNAPLTKFVPFTVNVNPAEPAAMLVGDNEVTVGTGFDGRSNRERHSTRLTTTRRWI